MFWRHVGQTAHLPPLYLLLCSHGRNKRKAPPPCPQHSTLLSCRVSSVSVGSPDLHLTCCCRSLDSTAFHGSKQLRHINITNPLLPHTAMDEVRTCQDGWLAVTLNDMDIPVTFRASLPCLLSNSRALPAWRRGYGPACPHVYPPSKITHLFLMKPLLSI